MPEGAIILDRMYFEKPEWLGQAREIGFSRAAAWIDLLALTNQRATVATVRGIQLNLERGECARSKLGLAERWGRSWSWITATLSAWEKDGRIQVRKCDNEMTVIYLTNFDAWQCGMARQFQPEGDQNGTRSGAERDQIGTEREKEKEKYKYRGEGEGEEEPRQGSFPEAVSDEAMMDFGRTWAGELASGTPEMDPGWVLDFIRRLNGRRELPRDWKRLMIASWRTDWRGWQKKNAAPVNGGLSPNVAAIQEQGQQRKVLAELAELENQVHQDRLGNLPWDAEKNARLKKLRAELKGLTA